MSWNFTGLKHVIIINVEKNIGDEEEPWGPAINVFECTPIKIFQSIIESIINTQINNPA